MKIVTFCEIDKTLFDSGFTVKSFAEYTDDKANIAILDISSIFDYEENKSDCLESEHVSIAIVDDESDYEAFKNFGIDAWIKIKDIAYINELIKLAQKKLMS